MVGRLKCRRISYLNSLDFIDREKIILAGTSTGGFAAINALSALDTEVQGVISINGGRCGKRGSIIGGLKHIKSLYRKKAEETTSPVYFLTGRKDDVIPSYSVTGMYNAFCESRDACEKSVFLLDNYLGTHHVATMMDEYKKALVALFGQ